MSNSSSSSIEENKSSIESGVSSESKVESSVSSTTSESSVASVSSEATKYSITVNPIDGATVNVVSESEAGKTVTFTITLTDAENKKVNTVTVKNGETEINLANNEGTYSFTMPEGNITIFVTLADVVHSYALTINKDANINEVKAKINGTEISDITSIEEGKTVELYVLCDEGYTVSSISGNPSDINLSTITEGASYSFVMPNGNLTITITSEKVPVSYKINSVDIVSSYISSVSGVEKDQEILSGTTVEVSVTLSGYSSDYGACIYVNDELVELTKNSSNSKLYEGSFVMPEENASIVASHLYFEESNKSKGSTFTLSNNDLYTIYGLKNNGFYKTDNSNYDYKSYKIVVAGKKGVKINKVYANVDDSTAEYKINAPDSSGSDNFYSINWAYWNATLTQNNIISIKVEAEYVGIKNVKLADSCVGKVSLVGDTEVVPGTKATFTVNTIAEYIILGVDKVVIEDGAETAMSKSEYSGWSYDSSSSQLKIAKMPNYDITIYFNVQKGLPVEVETNEYISKVEFESYNDSSYKTISKTAAVPGTTLRIFPTIADSSLAEIKAVKVNGEDASKYYSTRWDYKIPADTTAEKFVISIEVNLYHQITYDKNATTYKIYSISPTSKYSSGTKITTEIREVLGYKIDKAYLSNGTELTKSTTTEGYYSFTMPDEDVEIKVDTSAVATHALTVQKDDGIKSLTLKNKYGVTLTADDSGKIYVNEGDTIKASVSMNNGYELKSATFGDESLSTDSNIEFIVNADGILNLVSEEQAKGLINISLNENISISKVMDNLNIISSLEDGSYYGYVGHEMIIDFTLDSSVKNDYKLDKTGFVIKNKDGEDVDFTFSTSKMTFTMPEGGVTISAEPVAIPKASYTITGNLADAVVLTAKYGGYNYPESIITEGKVAAGTKLYIYLHLTDETYSSTYKYSLVVKEGDDVKLDKSFSSNNDYWTYTVTENGFTIEVNKNAK